MVEPAVPLISAGVQHVNQQVQHLLRLADSLLPGAWGR